MDIALVDSVSRLWIFADLSQAELEAVLPGLEEVSFGEGSWVMRRGDMQPAEARRLVAAGALLVDVRSREEFSAGHVAGAINLPVQELDRRMSELPRDKAMVLYCRSGHRSGRATEMLKAAGYGDVHNLGAMSRWPASP